MARPSRCATVLLRKLRGVQITIDSTEPLAKVTAVVGALYGVELVVSGEPAPVTTSRRRGRAAAAPASRKRSAGRSRRGGDKPDAKAVRAWAVEQGLTVSTRGQLSKSVLDAYRASH